MSNNASKRIAVNTLFLYARSFLIMIITLFSSRVILSVLGVEGYGVYNLVGGVVGLFTSLRGVFASSVQRFINYARGKGDETGVQHIFSIGFWIHLGLAILFFIVVGAFGAWFIPSKLVLPDGMLSTALFVFLFSLTSMVISIIGVPYDALIIANERMSFYAYIAIIEAVSKLAILYFLPILPFEGLRSYAVLLLIITVVLLTAKIIYCFRFAENQISWYWNRRLFKDLATFSGWNFFGNMVFTLVNEGSNMILNLFSGVVANAARGITYQIKAAIITLSNNVITASEPYIMQQAASVCNQELFNYLYRVSRIIFYIVLITTVPIIVYAPQILSLWLKEVPTFTEVFVRIVMLHVIIRSLHNPINTLFISVAKLKKYQIAEFLVGVSELPVMYILLKLGFPIYTPFIVMIIWEMLNLIVILQVANIEMGFSLKDYFNNVLTLCIKTIVLIGFIAFLFYYFTKNVNNITALAFIVLLIIVMAAMIFFCILDKEEKRMVYGIVTRILKRREDNA